MEKRKLWIALGIVGFVVVSLIMFLVFRKPSQRMAVTNTLPTQAALQTTVPTPMVSVTFTPTVQPGNVWVVMQIEEGAIYANGFYYDVATFSNLSQPSLTLRAQCMNPGWPSPEIGHQFTLIVSGVLVPIEGIESMIQRFLVLE